MTARSSYLRAFLVGIALALVPACGGGDEVPGSLPPQDPSDQAEGGERSQSAASQGTPQLVSARAAQAKLLISLRPLKVGLAASHHLGAPRGVQRLLPTQPDSENGPRTLLRGSRAPLSFRSEPSVCPSCGTLQSTLPVTALRLQAGSRRGDEEPMGQASYRLEVPVRLRAKRSNARAGWWDIIFSPEGTGRASVQPSRPWPVELGGSLGAPLSETALALAEAEAALLPGRAVLLSVLPWQTTDPDLRLHDLQVGLLDGVVELRLSSRKTFGADPVDLLLPAGRDLLLASSPEFLDALEGAAVPPAVAAQVEDGADGPEMAMEFVRVVDARGREGRLSQEVELDGRRTRVGGFGAARPLIRPTEKPGRSRPGENLPPRLRPGSAPEATR